MGHSDQQNSFFSLASVTEKLVLPENLPDIMQIVSMIVEPEIISIKVINTTRGLSLEGSNMTGKELVLQLKLKQKLLYEADVHERTIHTYQNECFQSFCIVIPEIIKGSAPEELIKSRYLETRVHIKNYSLRRINNRTIFKSIILFTNVILLPTYELCYSIQNSKSINNIFIAHEDGSSKKKIPICERNKKIMPKWSPNGNKLAFLSNNSIDKSRYMLYVYKNNSSIIKTTNEKMFDSVNSYDWHPDGNSIILSANKNNKKDVFSVDINNLKYKQLTYGNGDIKNDKPLYSPVGDKIAFLEYFSNVPNIRVMDANGKYLKKLTSSGFIKDFDWSKNGDSIAYIVDKDGRSDQICMAYLMNEKKLELKIPNWIIKINKVLFSPDSRYISFIASNLFTEDIFVYNLKSRIFSNLTKNFSNIRIKDFVWKMDSSCIYYSANDLQYYNIYTISLDGKFKYQITSTDSTDIRLDYCSRII